MGPSSVRDVVKRLIPILGVCAGLVACNPGHTRRDPETLPVVAPEAFGSADGEQADDAPDVGRWWERFGDPELDALIDRVVERNYDLRRMWAVLAQVEAGSGVAFSGRMPQVQASAGASRARSHQPGFDPASGGVTTQATTNNSYDVSVGVSYELDVWGRARDAAKAAALAAKATRLDVESMAMTLAATTAELWYQLIEQRALQALLERQLEVNQTLLELVQLRFEQGLASAVSVYQQRQQVALTESQLPPVRARVQLIGHQLATLAGEVPAVDVSAGAGSFPEPPGIPQVGLPSTVVQRRPDIRAARLRVESSDYALAAAIAEQFPRFTLTASTGFRANSFGDLLDRWVWQIAGQVVAPIFQGGRLKAQVKQRRAEVAAQLAGLASTMLTAFREVEDALVSNARTEELLAALERQVEVSQEVLRETRASYVQGVGDYLPVLTAVQALHASERQLVSARRQRLSNRIQVFRALGGEWTRDLEAPDDLLAEGDDEGRAEGRAEGEE